MSRRRLDAELVRRGQARSREHARQLVEEGRVRVRGAVATKPATQVDQAAALVVVDAPNGPDYVSRGAHKLLGALARFDPDGSMVRGRYALDAGASTGGFTDVLLRQGAAHVVAVDVGYGQLAWSLRRDERVTVMDRTNIRNLTVTDLPSLRSLTIEDVTNTGDPRIADLPDLADLPDHRNLAIEDPASTRPTTAGALPRRPELVVADLSFISLRLVLGPMASIVAEGADLVLMVKPQFEVGREALSRGGVVRDPVLREAAVLDVARAALDGGLGTAGVVASPLPGPSGNVEYFLHLRADAGPPEPAAVRRAVQEGPQ